MVVLAQSSATYQDAQRRHLATYPATLKHCNHKNQSFQLAYFGSSTQVRFLKIFSFEEIILKGNYLVWLLKSLGKKRNPSTKGY